MSDETNTEMPAHEATTEPHGEVPAVLTCAQVLEISKEASNVIGAAFQALEERYLKLHGGDQALEAGMDDPKMRQLQQEVVQAAIDGVVIAAAVLAISNGTEVGDFAKKTVDAWMAARDAVHRRGLEKFLGTVLGSIEDHNIMSAADQHPKA